MKSRPEADAAALDLRKKGLFTGQALIISKPSLLFDKFQEKPKPEVAEQGTVIPLKEKIAPVSASSMVDTEAPSMEETTAGSEMASSSPQNATMAAAATAEITEDKHQDDVDAKMPEPTQRAVKIKELNRGLGRNLRESSFALSLKHSYIEMDTEVDKRIRVTDTGRTTVPVTTDFRNDFPASFHMTTINARFGLTDFVELYADFGANYDFESSEPRYVYGLGLRQNLYETDFYTSSKLYFAFLADFHKGQFEEDYKSKAGDKWHKSSDWREIMLKLEGGIVYSRLIVFGGGNWLDYRETTTRRQLENLPAPFTTYRYEDELEEKKHWGFFGGVEYHLTGHSVICVEGNLINRNSITAAYEYRF